MDHEARFDRIEQKIDGLGEAISRLVVIDEKLSNQNARMAALEQVDARHADRLNRLERAHTQLIAYVSGGALVVGVVWEMAGRFWPH